MLWTDLKRFSILNLTYSDLMAEYIKYLRSYKLYIILFINILTPNTLTIKFSG